jgi:hypothetical protein
VCSMTANVILACWPTQAVGGAGYADHQWTGTDFRHSALRKADRTGIFAPIGREVDAIVDVDSTREGMVGVVRCLTMLCTIHETLPGVYSGARPDLVSEEWLRHIR